ncbi:DUF4865 family protein [Phyllobacterium myrsinacearum]|uniref:DUF4865 domain-containing protein n=1 Tax=Phyllobacterium myrsinacearum TaxID=28101 RepID=A0A839EKC9_9HYPH|nr:DUF4865 family protein [Phyllobacterium myrsinacearum]MBA8878705.1 hypothetical protein [Phyllobacterium myrsinacearum]
MIAMQYSFTLPADYDMAIIDRRIAEKGHLLDNYPHLQFKAYLSARRTDETRSSDNSYAPFYLWKEVQGLNNFLGGDGFAAVSEAFGRPQVNSWFVWQARIAPDIAQAVFATREFLPVDARIPLGDRRRLESERAIEDIEHPDIVASVTGFEPTSWTVVRFRLWGAEGPGPVNDATRIYRVGHMSLPK